jgi:RNA polymerase sigma factor (sigma-70 family)
MGELVLSVGTEATGRDPFVELAVRELDRAYRLAGLLLGNAMDAEDAAAEAFERAWANRRRFRRDAPFQPWFDRILVNVCRDRLRRQAKIRFIVLDESLDRGETTDGFQALFDRDELARSLEQLTPDERIVVVLRFWGDMTLEAVATRTGWPLGTVKSRLHRALKALRTDLDTARQADR